MACSAETSQTLKRKSVELALSGVELESWAEQTFNNYESVWPLTHPRAAAAVQIGHGTEQIHFDNGHFHHEIGEAGNEGLSPCRASLLLLQPLKHGLLFWRCQIGQ